MLIHVSNHIGVPRGKGKILTPEPPPKYRKNLKFFSIDLKSVIDNFLSNFLKNQPSPPANPTRNIFAYFCYFFLFSSNFFGLFQNLGTSVGGGCPTEPFALGAERAFGHLIPLEPKSWVRQWISFGGKHSYVFFLLIISYAALKRRRLIRISFIHGLRLNNEGSLKLNKTGKLVQQNKLARS